MIPIVIPPPTQSDSRVRWIFLGTTLGGALSIFASTWWGWPTAVNLILPALAMVVYFTACFAKRRDSLLTAEQIGDSFYYMGFLFTLASIAASLIQLGLQGSGQMDMASLLTRFGVAVLTTGLGMVARLCMVQFRFDELQAEPAARNSINAALTELAAEIRAGLTNFRQVRTGATAALDAALAKAEARIQEGNDARDRRVELLFSGIAARHDKALAQLEARIVAIKLEPDQLRAELREAMMGLEGEIVRVTTAVSGIVGASQAQGKAWHALSTRIDKAGEALGHIADQGNGLARLQESLGATGTNVAALNAALTEVAVTVTRIGRDLSDQQRSVAATALSTDATLTAMRDLPAEMRKTMDELRAGIAGSRDDASGHRHILVEELTRIRDLRSSIFEEVKVAIAATAQVYADLQASAEKLSAVVEGSNANQPA